MLSLNLTLRHWYKNTFLVVRAVFYACKYFYLDKLLKKRSFSLALFLARLPSLEYSDMGYKKYSYSMSHTNILIKPTTFYEKTKIKSTHNVFFLEEHQSLAIRFVSIRHQGAYFL